MRVGFGLCVQVCVYGTRLVSVREDCVCRPGVSMNILNVVPHQYFEHGVSPRASMKISNLVKCRRREKGPHAAVQRDRARAPLISRPRGFQVFKTVRHGHAACALDTKWYVTHSAVFDTG